MFFLYLLLFVYYFMLKIAVWFFLAHPPTAVTAWNHHQSSGFGQTPQQQEGPEPQLQKGTRYGRFSNQSTPF